MQPALTTCPITPSLLALYSLFDPLPTLQPCSYDLGALLWSVPGSFYCSCFWMQEKTPTDHLIKSLIKSPAADEPALSWTSDVFESKGSFLLFLTFTFLLLTVTVKTLWISLTRLSSWWSFSDLNYSHQNQQMTLKKVAIRCVTQRYQSLSVILKGVLPEEYTFMY